MNQIWSCNNHIRWNNPQLLNDHRALFTHANVNHSPNSFLAVIQRSSAVTNIGGTIIDN